MTATSTSRGRDYTARPALCMTPRTSRRGSGPIIDSKPPAWWRIWRRL